MLSLFHSSFATFSTTFLTRAIEKPRVLLARRSWEKNLPCLFCHHRVINQKVGSSRALLCDRRSLILATSLFLILLYPFSFKRLLLSGQGLRGLSIMANIWQWVPLTTRTLASSMNDSSATRGEKLSTFQASLGGSAFVSIG